MIKEQVEKQMIKGLIKFLKFNEAYPKYRQTHAKFAEILHKKPFNPHIKQFTAYDEYMWYIGPFAFQLGYCYHFSLRKELDFWFNLDRKWREEYYLWIYGHYRPFYYLLIKK